MKSKIKIILLITILIFFLAVIPVKASVAVDPNVIDENLKVTLISDKQELIAGEQLEVAINLDILDDKGITILIAGIEYDNNILELDEEKSFESNKETRWQYPTYSNRDGKIIIYSERNESKSTVSGEVYKLVFNILQTTESTDIKISNINCGNNDESLWAEDYTLSIKKETQEPDDDTEEKLYLSSEIYKIGNTNINNYEDGDNYISRVQKETKLNEYVNNLSTNGKIKVIKEDGTELTEEEYVGTGMTLIVTKDEEKIELKIGVMGDLDGNGKVTATDLSTLNQTIQKLVTLENVFKIAGDLDENENITATDLSTLNKIVLGIL